MQRSASSAIDPVVFWVAAGISALFVLIMIAMCYSLFKELRTETLPSVERRETPDLRRAVTRPTGAPAPAESRALDPTDRDLGR